MENRDVLYSIAIARHFGGRLERLEPGKELICTSADGEHPLGKLVVALRFFSSMACFVGMGMLFDVYVAIVYNN